MTQPTANPFALDERVNFMLFVTKRHLDNLRQLEDRTGSLAGDEVRNQAEIEINELLYHLVGVRDALLHWFTTKRRYARRNKKSTQSKRSKCKGYDKGDRRHGI